MDDDRERRDFLGGLRNVYNSGSWGGKWDDFDGDDEIYSLSHMKQKHYIHPGNLTSSPHTIIAKLKDSRRVS